MRYLLSSPAVKESFRFFEASAEQITDEHIRICSVPSSPFGEEQRAEYLRDKFRELGLSETVIDDEGNCLGLHRGASLEPLMIVSAHLDTVFPPATDFSVRRIANRLLGPGISDDGCGLAALIALARAFQLTQIKTAGSILFVGTVGEEGEGNLRGVRQLLTKSEWSARVDAFVSFDGPGVERITNRALGSRRYRVKLQGPGGHSWGDFGQPNPIHALGRVVSRLSSYPIPREPRTTFNVGRIEGGGSVNSIPAEALMDVDLRSAEDAELRRLDSYFRRSVLDVVNEENAGRRPGDSALRLELQLVGERPSGETPSSSTLVELAQEATRLLGVEPKLEQASTDSNLPMSLGIPAITLGAGGKSGSSHTLDEWYEAEDRDKGLKRGLLVILGLVRLRS
ncbi:MAG TPA: M20/M25/M40 family metallo-hydrolase [Pyrinomonadaceae bacterium]|nr:M20/M25/M40 family metallo-hydrolase [Pyrinomonadaceae bacterium]